MGRWLTALVASVMVVSACGAPAAQAPAISVPTPATTSPSVTPAPTPAPTSGPATQEPTDRGTITLISNWDDYADDPVVRFFREWNALMAAAVNEGEFSDELTAMLDPALLERILPLFRQAWAEKWTTEPEIRARILSVKADGDTSIVESCMPNSSLSLKTSDGGFVTPADEFGSSINVHTFVRSDTEPGFVVRALGEVAGAC